MANLDEVYKMEEYLRNSCNKNKQKETYKIELPQTKNDIKQYYCETEEQANQLRRTLNKNNPKLMLLKVANTNYYITCETIYN